MERSLKNKILILVLHYFEYERKSNKLKPNNTTKVEIHNQQHLLRIS